LFLDEFQIIREFFDQPLADPAVLTGIGDDGAIIAPDSGLDLVTVVDTMVESIHFPHDFAPDDAGYRALAVNLSDIAAMGARPRWMTLALTLDDANENWLQGFAAGLFAAAREYEVSLVGGDTTRGQQKVISIQLMGDIEPGKALRRSGARAGDLLFVSGTVGDAAAGLSLADDHFSESDYSRYLWQRFARPSARVSLGQALTGVASAAIDISDGLYTDITKLFEMSNVSGHIEARSLPVSKELRSFCENDDDVLNFALGGGDDYELCFAVPPEKEPAVMALRDELGMAITRIGELTEGKGLTCMQDGSALHYEDQGYRHF
jgi:thiamine-monophosphate kinase